MFVLKFSLHTPWNRFLREPWADNVYPTMIIWRRLASLRPKSTSIVTMNGKTQQSTKLIWMMGGKGADMRHLSTSLITISNLSIIFKGILDYLLRPTSRSSITPPTITYFTVMKTIIKTTRSNIYTQQSTMVTWVIGGRKSGLGTIFTYPITIKIFCNIVIGRVDGLFRSRFTSSIINTYIILLVTIITTYI